MARRASKNQQHRTLFLVGVLGAIAGLAWVVMRGRQSQTTTAGGLVLGTGSGASSGGAPFQYQTGTLGADWNLHIPTGFNPPGMPMLTDPEPRPIPTPPPTSPDGGAGGGLAGITLPDTSGLPPLGLW